MKFIKWFLLSTFLILAFSQFSSSVNSQSNPLSTFGTTAQACRIMPVGDSITAGIGSTNDTHGYRVPLYNGLVGQGYLPQFVGTQVGNSTVIPVADDFHEGYPGNTTDYFEPRIYNLLTQNPADVILIHLGTNDITSNDVDPNDDLAIVLDEIDRYEQDNAVTIPVVVAQIINRACPGFGSCSTKATQTATYNQNVATLVQNRITSGDNLILVDMENDANLDYTFNGPDFAASDDLHPNDTGYAKMAGIWQPQLQTLCSQGSTTPTATPMITPTVTPIITPTVTPMITPTATPTATPSFIYYLPFVKK